MPRQILFLSLALMWTMGLFLATLIIMRNPRLSSWRPKFGSLALFLVSSSVSSLFMTMGVTMLGLVCYVLIVGQGGETGSAKQFTTFLVLVGTFLGSAAGASGTADIR